MSIIVFSDLHLSKKWDDLDSVFPKKLNFLNPNRYLREILSRFQTKDIIIFNGDIVDYYYCDHHLKQNNWDIFFDMLKKCKAQCYFNTGNHDYRKTPYNFGMYKLNHVNIDNKVYKKYRKKIGFNTFRYRKEFDSIRVNVKKFNPIPKKINNSKKYFERKNQSIILLNTGPDAFTQMKCLINPLKWTSVLSTHPSSLGISNNDISLLDTMLNRKDRKEVILFLHCPPFFSKKKIPTVHLSKLTYQLQLFKHTLNHATFYKNNWKLLQVMMQSKKNITVISSHSHIPKQYCIDKKNHTLRESSIPELNRLRHQARYIKFISTLPLGAINTNKSIGYTIIKEDSITYNVIKTF